MTKNFASFVKTTWIKLVKWSRMVKNGQEWSRMQIFVFTHMYPLYPTPIGPINVKN